MIREAVNSLPEGRVLVAPLNWGLGHAARCVPLINELLLSGKEVVLAADGKPLAFLRSEFPNLPFVEFHGLNVRYSKTNSQIASMLFQTPKFLWGILMEHKRLKKIINQYDIGIVISDNRFGLWNKSVCSVYLTHQLMVKMPGNLKFLEKLGWSIHRKFISHYDMCWVPDLEGKDNLSGDLSHKYPLLPNTSYIGVLTRFTSDVVRWCDISAEALRIGLIRKYSTVVIISGPEPHRSYLQQWAVSNCDPGSTLIVQGQPDRKDLKLKNPRIVPHLPTLLLQYYMQQADKIICRSGYSSIMDLYALGRKAELIPTPGQTEQEYLKTLHDK